MKIIAKWFSMKIIAKHLWGSQPKLELFRVHMRTNPWSIPMDRFPLHFTAHLFLVWPFGFSSGGSSIMSWQDWAWSKLFGVLGEHWVSNINTCTETQKHSSEPDSPGISEWPWAGCLFFSHVYSLRRNENNSSYLPSMLVEGIKYVRFFLYYRLL